LKDFSKIRERYLRDTIQIRLGGIAANLARVCSFARNPGNKAAAESLIEECKYFIEWTAPAAENDTRNYLVLRQIEFALWQLKWDTIWSDEKKRSEIAALSKSYSEKILRLSGLLDG